MDQLFHALSDRTRRALLARLEQSPASIGELAEPFAMSLPAVSKHLRVLEAAGLVVRVVDGRIHRCSFAAEPLRDVERWLAHYRAFWSDQLDSLADFIEGPREKGNRS